MLKFLRDRFGFDVSYKIATFLDIVKNFLAAYLFAVFIGWSFNPLDWSMAHSGVGRFVLILYVLIVVLLTFKD